jgi:hypothetical protein
VVELKLKKFLFIQRFETKEVNVQKIANAVGGGFFVRDIPKIAFLHSTDSVNCEKSSPDSNWPGRALLLLGDTIWGFCAKS